MEVQVHLPTKVNASLHHLLILHRKNYSSVSIANLSEILTFSFAQLDRNTNGEKTKARIYIIHLFLH